MTNLEFEEVMKTIIKQNPTLLKTVKTQGKKSVYYLGSVAISCNKTVTKTQYAEINGKIPLEVAKVMYEKYSNPLYGIKIVQTTYPEKLNPNPIDYAIDEVYEKEMRNYQMQGPEILSKNKERALEKLHQRPDKNKYIKKYLIETKEGLIALLTELEEYISKEKRKKGLATNKIISFTDIFAENSNENAEVKEQKKKEILEEVTKNILEKIHPEQSTEDWLNRLQINQATASDIVEGYNPEFQKLREALNDFDKAINPYMNEEIQLKERKDYLEDVVIEADYDASNKKSIIKFSNPKEKDTQYYIRTVQTIKTPEGISYAIEYDHGDGSALQMKHEYNIYQGEILTINKFLYNCITQRTVYNITNGTIKVLSSEEITVDSNMQSLMAIDVASATSLAETITTNNMAKKGYTKTLSKKKN